jgi:hypothetical protein
LIRKNPVQFLIYIHRRDAKRAEEFVLHSARASVGVKESDKFYLARRAVVFSLFGLSAKSEKKN